MNEIWKDILGYEGLYQVSNLGRIKSLARLKSRYNAPSIGMFGISLQLLFFPEFLSVC